MHPTRPTIAAACCAIAAVAIIAPPASAVPIHKHVEKTVRHHQLLNGKRADQDGLIFLRWTSTKVVVRKYDVAPPYVPPVAEPTVTDSSSESTPSALPTTVASTSASSGCTGMEAESGTAGYDAYNASSGATGCYQILPSTAAAYACDLSTPAGQDSCAAAICAGQGPSAWASSGANPC